MTEEWINCKVGDLLTVKNGFAFKSKEYQKDGVPVVRIGDIQEWKVDVENTKRVPENPEFESYEIKRGDILIAMSGATTGKFGQYASEEKAYQNQRVGNLRPHNENLVYNAYVYYLLYPLKREIEKEAYGGAQPNISASKIENLETLLFPLPIQRAIVAKIDELFSSLDSGIADLKKAQEQLKVYRQALLKKAFEGGLTRDWRKEHQNLPTPQKLLRETREKRKEHFKKQLEDWKKALQKWKVSGQGKKPIKPKTLKFFDEPVREIDLNIPKNWFVDTIGNLSTGVEYGSSAKSLDDGDIPVIRMGNMQEGKINWDDLKYSTSLDEINQYSLRSGDVLFNRTNSPELVGKSALYNGERDAIFAGYLIRINHVPSIILSSYLNYFLNSHPAKVYGSFVKTDGVNQSNINGQKLSNYPIPLCSIEEQKEIVIRLDEIFSVCERISIDISEGFKKAEALRQSILKRAFEGKLLSEEELEKCRKELDYEPADVLLQRIKTEKKKK